MININQNMTCHSCRKDIGSNIVECEHCLKYLNWQRTIFNPPYWATSEENSIEKMQSWAMNMQKEMFKDIVEFQDAGEMFKFMKLYQALFSNSQVAYNSIVVKERIPNVNKAESSAVFADAVKQQKKDNLPKREQKLLTDFEKAVNKAYEMLKNTGMTREQVEEMVHKGRNQQGKTIGSLEFMKT